MQSLDTLQTHLDEVGSMVMAGDFASYADRVSLPFVLLTETTTLVVRTSQDLQNGFDEFQRTLSTQHVTDMIRLAYGAIQLSEHLLSGRYVTHLLCKAHRVVPPFRSQIILRQERGIWRAASIANSLYNMRWPILMPLVAPGTDAT